MARAAAWILGAALAGSAGCIAPSDRRDASRDAVGPLDAHRQAPVLVTGLMADPTDPTLPSSPRPADLSCLGVRRRPAGDTSARLLLLTREGMPLAGACARVYEGAVAPSDPCSDADMRADDEGFLALAPPVAAPFAVRVFGRRGETTLDSYPETVLFDLSNDLEPATAAAYVASSATVNEIALVTATAVDPAAAMVVIRFEDCSRRLVYGATLRLFRADGTPIETQSGPTRVVYADGTNRASALQPWTHVDGLAAAINVEVREPGEVLFVELVGRGSLRDEPSVVACETVQIFPRTVSIPSLVQPVRADAPACPELR